MVAEKVEYMIKENNEGMGLKPKYYTTLSEPREPIWRVRLWYSKTLAELDEHGTIIRMEDS